MNFCDCETDGFCPRYQKDQYGRNREICAGINVDLGTAAQFRLIWRAEAEMKSMRIGVDMTGQLFQPGRVLILKNAQRPGDVLVMTAAIYSLHRQHPGRYLTAVDTPCPEIFANNPDVISLAAAQETGIAEEVEMHYPAISQSNERGIHFMQGWCEFLGHSLGVEVPLLTNRPMIYLSEAEQARPMLRDETPWPTKQAWLINSGVTRDLTAKAWGHDRFQEVVNSLVPFVTFVQVGSEADEHRPLKHAVKLIGKTSLRELIVLAAKADGILCGVTMLQHLAAAVQKPSVVILGGRESVTWNQYPMQTTLHSIGVLPCCKTGGCWKSRVKPLMDGSPEDLSLCERPRGEVGECMDFITPREVVQKILRYCT
jgi:ADP-heptose:LPS heptosyltransferase